VSGYYYSFNQYLREKFGERVHRISLNAGFTCPNRNGKLSREGCIFCNEDGFSHFAGSSASLEEQIEASMAFYRNRFKTEKFIAYFQNATNTYERADRLKKTYDVIKKFPEIIGLFISTRPDCINQEKLDLIEKYQDKYEVWLEYGLQSIHDRTLAKINRMHNFSQTVKAIEDTSKRKIKVAVHVILGLPDETQEDMLNTAKSIAKLPIGGVKLHVLHVLRDTKLEKLYNDGKIKLLDKDEYVSLACNFLEYLNPKCVILRLISDAKDEVLIAPKWINCKHKVIGNIENEFKKRNTRQGIKYAKESLCIR